MNSLVSGNSYYAGKDFLVRLPKDLQELISNYLTPSDLVKCSRVSKAWKAVFNADHMWERTAREYKVERCEVHPWVQIAIKSTSYCRYISERINSYFHKSTKSLVLQKLENEIEINWPKEFLQIFGSSQVIIRLPVLQRKHLLSSETANSSGPIWRLMETDKKGGRAYSFVLHVRNNETGEFFWEQIGIYILRGDTLYCEQILSQLNGECKRFASLGNPPLYVSSLERLERLVKNEPVGTKVYDWGYRLIEGPRTTAEGKSVIELVERAKK